MSPWLARLSGTFFIAGAYLAWQAYRGVKGELGSISDLRIVLFMFGAVISIVMGVVGIRERHKRTDDLY